MFYIAIISGLTKGLN